MLPVGAGQLFCAQIACYFYLAVVIFYGLYMGQGFSAVYAEYCGLKLSVAGAVVKLLSVADKLKGYGGIGHYYP